MKRSSSGLRRNASALSLSSLDDGVDGLAWITLTREGVPPYTLRVTDAFLPAAMQLWGETELLGETELEIAGSYLRVVLR